MYPYVPVYRRTCIGDIAETTLVSAEIHRRRRMKKAAGARKVFFERVDKDRTPIECSGERDSSRFWDYKDVTADKDRTWKRHRNTQYHC